MQVIVGFRFWTSSLEGRQRIQDTILEISRGTSSIQCLIAIRAYSIAVDVASEPTMYALLKFGIGYHSRSEHYGEAELHPHYVITKSNFILNPIDLGFLLSTAHHLTVI